MRKDILNTTAIALVGRACGFFVPFVIAAVFGSTRETDVFFLVFGCILCLMLIMRHLFESVMVPHITDECARGKNVDRLVGAILTRTTLWLGLLLLVALPAVRPVLAVATQLPPASLDLAFQIFLLMAPTALLMAWTSALIGALNADKVFHVGALSPLFRSATVILFVVAFHGRWGIYSVAWGYVFGEVVRLLVALHAFINRSHRLELTWTVNAATADFFASAAYQTVGFGLLCLAPIVNYLTASWLAAGELSILAYALQLRNVPALLFSTGLGSVVLSHWARQNSRSSGEFSWPRVKRTLGEMFLIAAVSAGGLILCRGQIASIVLGWGTFPQDKLPLVAQLFALFVVSLPFDVTTLLCVRVLIILKSDVAYMRLAALKLVLLIVLNCILVPAYGLIGIGIAMSVMNILHAVALFFFVTRQRALLSGPSSSPERGPRSVSHPPYEVARETT